MEGHGGQEAYRRGESRKIRSPSVVRQFGEMQGQPPVCTAVVVIWQGSTSWRECLQSLRDAAELVSAAVEIIVVNNGSEHSSSAKDSHLWDGWIDLAENKGPSAARNVGAFMAEGEIVAFVDDDALVAPDYFKAALPYFENPQTLGIRGRLLPLRHPYFTSLATHYDRGPQPIEDALITEGACLIRRRVFIDSGGFPVEIFGHEGIELTGRLQRSEPGGHTLYAPDVVLRHDYLDSWADFFEKVTRCAQNEEELPDRDPHAAQFLKEYFKRSFQRPSLPITRRAARRGLIALRGILQGVNATRRVMIAFVFPSAFAAHKRSSPRV